MREALIKNCAWLQGQGFYIFPLVPGTKKPLVKWREESTNELDPTLDWPADCGVGIDCGKSNLVILDCDNHSDTRPPAPWDVPGVTTGEDALALLWAAEAPDDSPWAACPTVLTPSGGVHLYYRAGDTQVKNSAGRLAWQVDVRADGGYVVAPGTTLADGGTYQPIHWPQDPPHVPAWVEHLLRPPAVRTWTPPSSTGSIFAPAPGPDPDAPEADRIRLAVARKVAEAQPGERNQLLNWAAYRLAEQLLDDTGAGMLADAARAIGLTDREITNTLRSATRATQGDQP